MNGLKFIRKMCNLSICDIANILSISRQVVSAWESGKKKIPENRKDELSDFLGIDKKYFEEIDSADEKYILNQFMYIHFMNNKDIFLFRSNPSEPEEHQFKVLYNSFPQITLSEEYENANKLKQETLKRVDNVISKCSSPYMMDDVTNIKKNCRMYGYLNDILENILDSDPRQKVRKRYGLENIFLAIKLAYGLINEDDINFEESNSAYSSKWIFQLSEIIKDQLAESTL